LDVLSTLAPGACGGRAESDCRAPAGVARHLRPLRAGACVRHPRDPSDPFDSDPRTLFKEIALKPL